MFTIKVFEETNELEFVTQQLSLGRCKIDKFNQAYGASYKPLRGEMIPPVVRYIGDTTDGGRVIVYEERPQYHLFQWTPKSQENLKKDDTASEHSYLLPFPWVQYVIKLSPTYIVEDVWGFMSTTPMGNKSTHHTIPMHNWYTEGKLCRPLYAGAAPDFGNSVFSILNGVLTEMWQSGFNNDLYKTVSEYFSYADANSNKDTLFAAKSMQTWHKLYGNGGGAQFFKSYYEGWAQRSIDEMLSLKYTSSHSVNMVQFVANFSPNPNRESTIKWTELNAKILGAAQNATLM